ncbi:putative T7SS-secreted protein [Saccharopolyspora griseoalba]|uniref:T7SS-secreted protein n=1 Tax=Saccharopolyspora griseoalba TaxID=1431848 RepID=A0ABW2LQN5_9PSEU
MTISNSSSFSEDMDTIGRGLGLVEDEIPGDPQEAQHLADLLVRAADGWRQAAADIGSVDSGGWTGEAAEAARDILRDKLPARYDRAAHAYRTAGTAVEAFAAVLGREKPRGMEAVRRRDDALQRAQSCDAQYAQACAAFNDGGPDPGDPPANPARAEAQAAAQEVAEAKAAIATAEAEAASAVRAAAKEAPEGPGLFAQLAEFGQDLAQAGWTVGGELATGVWNGAIGTVSGVVQFAKMTQPSWALTQEAQQFNTALGELAASASTDPTGTGWSVTKAALNVDGFAKNPVQAAGEALPALLTMGGGGIGIASRFIGRTGKTVGKTTEDAAEAVPTPHTPEPPQRPAPQLHEAGHETVDDLDGGLNTLDGGPNTPDKDTSAFHVPSRDAPHTSPNGNLGPDIGRDVHSPTARPETHDHPGPQQHLQDPTAQQDVFRPNGGPPKPMSWEHEPHFEPDNRMDGSRQPLDRPTIEHAADSDPPPRDHDQPARHSDTPSAHHGEHEDAEHRSAEATEDDRPEHDANHDNEPHEDNEYPRDDGDEHTHDDGDGSTGETPGTPEPGDLPEYNTREMDSKYEGEHLPGNDIFGTPVTYLDEVQREAFRLHVDEDGLLRDADGDLFDSSGASTVQHPDDGRAIFVMDENGRIYASTDHEAGRFHHSSFLSGQPAAAAGELVVKDGKVELITNQSGHYKPMEADIAQFMRHLFRREGAPLDEETFGLNLVKGTYT